MADDVTFWREHVRVSIKGVRFKNRIREPQATRRGIYLLLCYLFPREETDTQGKFTCTTSCMLAMFYYAWVTSTHLCAFLQMQKCIGGVCVSLIFCALLTETIGMVIAVRVASVHRLMLCFIANQMHCDVLLCCVWNRQKRREDGLWTVLAISSVLVSFPHSFKLIGYFFRQK